MNILVTGARGMVGTALCNNLKNIRDGKNKTRPALHIEEIYEYDLNSTPEELDEYCRKADFVFNLAGVNRPENPEDFMKGNFGFASNLLNCLKKHNNKATIMLSSSIQATLAGRFGNSEYGRSKKAGEELFFDYAKETGAKVAVYRFPNLMGHSRPKYNSAVSTFCWAVANDEPFTVNDRSTKLELLYIDDLVEGMFDLLESKEQHCEFDGVKTVLKEDGRYCCVPVTHKVTLGEIVDLLQEFKAQPNTLMMPKMPDGSFAKKLYSLYLTYLPTDKFKYALKMNVDNRGSFTELVHTADCGHVSINISCPGITKGQHWHNSKWELFIVVAGHGLIQERNINTGETVEFEVSGDKIEAVHMIPGWTHNIINLSETENLMAHLWDKTKHFVKKAFTIIFASTIVIWFLTHFSFQWELLSDERIDESILAGISKLVQPVFTPLGFGYNNSKLYTYGWVFAVAAVSGLIAKENVIATFATLATCIVAKCPEIAAYNINAESGIGAVVAMIQASGVSVPALLAFIAFNMTTIPCFAAVGTAKAELQNKNRYRWTLLFWVATSYIVGTMIYTIGSWWWTSFIWAAAIALVVLGIVYYNKMRETKVKA